MSNDPMTIHTLKDLIKVSEIEEPQRLIFIAIPTSKNEGMINISIESYVKMSSLSKDLQNKIREQFKQILILH